jgi:thiosulfate dehydrogenase
VLATESQEVRYYMFPRVQVILAQHNAGEIFYSKRLLGDCMVLPENVGAAMNCNSCHLPGGKVDAANGYVNNFYPRVMPRAGKMVGLEMPIKRRY